MRLLHKAIYGYKLQTMNNPIPLYDFVMAHLRAKTTPRRIIAKGADVPFSTVCKIAQGTIKDPSVHAMQRLADYFLNQERH